MPEDQAVTPIIERRRIEAELLKEVYETLKAKLGREEAQDLIAESVRRSARHPQPHDARRLASRRHTKRCRFEDSLPPHSTIQREERISTTYLKL